MSWRANVDIVIALSALRIVSFRKQGRLRFRLSLLHTSRNPDPKLPPRYCTPYNIYKHERTRGSREQPGVGSEIDHDQECYYSRVFESKYQSQNHKIEECCYFRAYVDAQDLDNARLAIRVELLFAPEGQEGFVEAGTYEGTVHRLTHLCTSLPVIFDEFGGFTVSGVYQSTVIEYRFEAAEKQGEFASFAHYLHAATHALAPQPLREFYDYYRGSLEAELFHIQERHSDLLRLLGVPANYGFIKVGPNLPLLALIAAGAPQGLSRSRSRQHLWGGGEGRERVAEELTCDFNGLKGLIYQKWNEYIVFMSERIEQLTEHFRVAYDANVRERLRSHVFSHQVEPRFDWTFSRYEDSGRELLKQAEMDKLKQKDEEMWREAFPIENKDFFEEEGKTIKIFEEVCPVQNLRRTLTQHSTHHPLSHSTALILHPGSRKSSFELASSTVSQGTFLPSKSYQELLPSRSVLQFHGGSEKLMGMGVGREERLGMNTRPEHIVIFVHGYQASRQDFVLFKSCLEVKYRCRVFISSANEGRTEESMEALGKRLAVELNNFFKNVEFGAGTRVSFVGHSMGGIIIRSALTYIRNLDQYLWAYLSFSSPHLGYLYEPSALVQAGLWLLNALQKSESIDQLCMRDAEDPRRCFLYRLTENRSLEGFRQLALISSSQDEYVPYESARIEKNPLLLARSDGVGASVIREMVDNLLSEARCVEISRMNVVFNIESSNFDSLVGRTAHVKYLSDQKFIKMFTSVFDKFFS